MTFDLKKLNLMSLEKRRSLADVTFLYKVLNGNIDIDISKIIDFHLEADRFPLSAKDSLTLKKKYARTNVLKYSFFLENSELEEVKEFKDLGIITNHHLSWNPHIDYIVSKANRILGLIKRIVKVWMTLRPCVLFTAHWSTQIWNIVQRCGPHIQREILISWKEYREERLNLS